MRTVHLARVALAIVLAGASFDHGFGLVTACPVVRVGPGETPRYP
jgi:hypothetical protein